MDLRRFEFDGRMEERGGQQFVSGRSFFGDGFTRIVRVEPHGFMSNPVKGAKGVVLSPHPDQSYVLGLEHPLHRPAGLPGGSTAIYDASGNIISLVGNKVRIVGPLIEIVGPVNIDGDLHVTGDITCAGTVTDSDGNNGA